MRFSSIPHLYRNVKRWTEIVSVLSKYGLADWLSRTNIDFIKNRLKDRDGEVLSHHTRETRIRLALTELGPTFIKLGQLLSTRPDLVGQELADELSQLQADVPADTADAVRAIVEKELGRSLEECFAQFEAEPVASASIGQIHRAHLHSGEKVVVKVQHAGIERTVHEDLDVLAGLALLAEQFPEFANYRPAATVTEMGRMLRRELDFNRELSHLQQFAALFAGDESIRIPRVWSDYCTPRVITMDYLEGTSVADARGLEAQAVNCAAIARRGAEIYLQMIFTHGYFHADPHPGNILVLPGDIIGLIDFGLVGRLDEQLRESIEEMLSALTQHDTPLMTLLLKRIGRVPSSLDESSFQNDVADFTGHYATQSLDRFDLSGALNDMMEIIRRYHIQLPPQAALLIKVLVTLEGTAKKLSPHFSLMELIQPFRSRMLFQRLSPMRNIRKLRRFGMEMEQLAQIFPRRAVEILDQVQAGKFDVHLDHRGLGPSVNRLVLGMLASALFLGSSLMLSYAVPPVLFPVGTYWGMHKLSILGLLGCGFSILLGFRLFYAIGKSGHLDQK